MTARKLIAVLATVACALVTACSIGPTQIVVIVNTDFAIPDELDAVDIVVSGPNGPMTSSTAQLAGASAVRLPLTLGIVPGSAGPNALVSVTVQGRIGARTIVTRSIDTHFIAGRSLALEIFLSRNCASLTLNCVADLTCIDGACTSRSVDPVTLPTFPLSDAGADAHDGGLFVRGVLGRDSSDSGLSVIQSVGFNSVVIDSPDRADLDTIAANGLHAIVRLGDWDGTPTCAFHYDSTYVNQRVPPIAGHRAIAAYLLSDGEMNARECPGSPAAARARSDLLHQLDPGSTTALNLDSSDGVTEFAYAPWVGATDVAGLIVRPCALSRGCDFARIDSALMAAQGANLPRIWAIVQDFGDDYYLLPTADQLRMEFDRWSAGPLEGYIVDEWVSASGSVESQPGQLDVFREENARAFR